MKEYPGKLIAVLHRKTQIHWNRELKQYGISASEFPVLFQLYHQEGVTQDELSLALSLDKAAVTRTIQSLIDKGFVEKQRDAEDHRCNRVFLTAGGKELREAVDEARDRLGSQMMNQMSPEERQEFLRLLQLAVRSMQRMEEQNK